jgi:hypothetical protein
VRFVAAELLAMADDGLLTVQADNVGYTLRVDSDPAQLGPGRRAILAGLARGDSEMLLPRPPDDPRDDGRMKGSRLSVDSLVTAVAREGEATGMASRAGWLLVGVGIAGLCGVIASFLLGASVVGYVLIACVGLLASWWNARRVQPSRKGRVEQGRLLALREQLRAEAGASGPATPVPPFRQGHLRLNPSRPLLHVSVIPVVLVPGRWSAAAGQPRFRRKLAWLSSARPMRQR